MQLSFWLKLLPLVIFILQCNCCSIRPRKMFTFSSLSGWLSSPICTQWLSHIAITTRLQYIHVTFNLSLALNRFLMKKSSEFCYYIIYIWLICADELILYLFKIQPVSQVLMACAVCVSLSDSNGPGTWCFSTINLFLSEDIKESLWYGICCWHQLKEVKYPTRRVLNRCLCWTQALEDSFQHFDRWSFLFFKFL